MSARHFALRPHWLARLIQNRFATSHLPRSQQKILLTFDDGPHPEYTPQVLDLLKSHNAKAMFFVIGNRVQQNPHLLQQIHDAGHTIGNHTNTHPRFPFRNGKTAREELRACQSIIRSVVNVEPKDLRPPFGRITPGLLFAAQHARLRIWNWSLDSGDWRCRTDSDAAECAEALLNEARPGDVILLHDANPFISQILHLVLPTWGDRGWLSEPARGLALIPATSHTHPLHELWNHFDFPE